jgi:predicted amidophosphoribosyltransferase
MFRPVSQYRRLCSPECRQDSLRDRRKRQAKPFSKCSDCGKELSHRRGGRCRECWRANPRFYDEPGEVRQ